MTMVEKVILVKHSVVSVPAAGVISSSDKAKERIVVVKDSIATMLSMLERSDDAKIEQRLHKTQLHLLDLLDAQEEQLEAVFDV